MGINSRQFLEQDIQNTQCMATEIPVSVSCLSLNFSTLIKLSWSVMLWAPQTEQGTMILPTLFLANVAIFCQFCGTVFSLFWSFIPSTTQLVDFLLPYLNLLPAITSFSHICFPLPFISTETLWSSVQIFPSPFSDFPFLGIVLDHLSHIQHEMSSVGRKTQQLYWMCSSCLWLRDKKEIAISDRQCFQMLGMGQPWGRKILTKGSNPSYLSVARNTIFLICQMNLSCFYHSLSAIWHCILTH